MRELSLLEAKLLKGEDSYVDRIDNNPLVRCLEKSSKLSPSQELNEAYESVMAGKDNESLRF
jgi:hypothetical protein